MTTTRNTQTCKNIFLEDDGYCTACGKYHFTESFGRLTIYAQPVEDSNPGYSDCEDTTEASDPLDYEDGSKSTVTTKRLVGNRPTDVVVKVNGVVTYQALHLTSK